MTEPSDDLTLGQLRLLVSAADEGSFTRAAARAGLSPAAVSKMVHRLERRLGIQLFIRTTRKMRLTDTGADYLARCREALDLLHEAGRLATEDQATPSGRLRLSVPTPYAYYRLLPRLPAFRQRYPAVSLDVQISDRPVSLTGEQFDLAIRGHEMADSGLIARKLEDAELVVVASPSYIAAAPPLRAMDDLTRHQCVQFRLPESGRIAPWSFRVDGERELIDTDGGIVCEDHYMAGIPLALAGAGLCQMYRFAVADDLAAGRLVEVMAAFGGTTRPFYLVHPGGTRRAGVGALIDFLFEGHDERSTSNEPAAHGALSKQSSPPCPALLAAADATLHQPVPLLQLLTRGDPAGGDDVRPLPAQPQERRGPAVRARHRHLP